MLPTLLIVVALVGLLGLFFWRSKLARTAPPAPVAASNHKSVRSFDYGPKPVESVAAAAAPAATAAEVLEQFMPAEDAGPQPPAKAQVAPATAAPKEVAALAPVAAVANEPAAVASQAVVAPEPAAPTTALSALDMLGDDELPAPKAAAPDPSTNQAEPDPSLFYNPFTAPAPTANDEANRLAEAELRKQQRAARRAGSGAQKEALSTLYKQG